MQVVLAEENLARAGWRTEDVLSYEGGRGNIVDRRGSLLAGAAPAFDLDYRRTAVEALPAPDRDRVLRALERFPRFSREAYDAWAASGPLIVNVGLGSVDIRPRGDWARLAYGVSPAALDALRESLGSIDMSWLVTIPTFRRTYPRDSLAGWVIGYASRAGAGASSGLERMFDAELAAGTVRVGLVRDEDREPYLRGELVEFANAAGATVETTLDAELQAVADRAVADMVERESALRGVAIVSRIGTGEILAMTTYPPFDPGAPITEENAPGADWATTAVVEPGSTIKMFTFAAAIDAGVIGYDTELDCADGVLRLPGATYRDDHCDGTIAAWDALRVSSNIGAIRMAMRMSAQQHHAYLRAFGFGQRTGLDVPVEARGNLPSAANGWEAYRQASIAYGYAMGLTPIQLNVATATIGNGGIRMAPYLVRRIVSAEGDVLFERSPEPVIRAVSERAARLTTRAMETVVSDDEGTASAAAVPGHRVAGKTGTVERWDEEARAYEDGQYLSSFSRVRAGRQPALRHHRHDRPPGRVRRRVLRRPGRRAGVCGDRRHRAHARRLGRGGRRGGRCRRGRRHGRPSARRRDCRHPQRSGLCRHDGAGSAACLHARRRADLGRGRWSGGASVRAGRRPRHAADPCVPSTRGARSVNVSGLASAASLTRLTPGDAEVRAIVTDSRAVTPGALFVARKGWFIDSHRFIPGAVAAGAAAVIVSDVEAADPALGVPMFLATSEDRDLGLVCDAFFGQPTRELRVFGVTGTNGKTSVSYLLEHLLRALGERPAVIGTVSHRFESRVIPARNTTPDGLTIHGFARECIDAGATCLVIETSSHGIHLGRIAGVAFDCVGFTNLSPEHLDYHETMAAYRDAKAALFADYLDASRGAGKAPVAVIWGDDDASAHMAGLAATRAGVVRVGHHERADLHVDVVDALGADGFRVRLSGQGAASEFTLPLVGMHNVANAAVAVGMVVGMQTGALADAVAALASFPGIPGRVERAFDPALRGRVPRRLRPHTRRGGRGRARRRRARRRPDDAGRGLRRGPGPHQARADAPRRARRGGPRDHHRRQPALRGPGANPGRDDGWSRLRRRSRAPHPGQR